MIGRPRPVLAAALLLLTGATWRVSQLGHAILPSSEPVDLEREVAPGDLIMQSPVGARRTAVLLDEMAIAPGGRARTVARGSALVDALLEGRSVRKLDPSALEFCTPAPPLLCVVDYNSDGMIDHAVLPNPADAAPDPIAVTPARYVVRTDVPLPGESAIRVRFLGLSGDALRFRVELVEQGRAVGFTNGSRRVPAGALPVMVDVMAGAFEVTAIEPRTQHIRALVRRPIAPGPYTLDAHAPGLLESLLLGRMAPDTHTLDRAPVAEAPPQE